MIHTFKLLVTSCVAWVALGGCATIIQGDTQKIGISSSPTGARVSVKKDSLGVTPIFVEFERGDEHVVTIELEGYEKAELTLTKSVSNWIWGNIVLGGLIGLAIDAATGAMYELSPEQLNVELKKSGTSSINKDGQLYVITVLRPEQNWTKIGNLTAK